VGLVLISAGVLVGFWILGWVIRRMMRFVEGSGTVPTGATAPEPGPGPDGSRPAPEPGGPPAPAGPGSTEPSSIPPPPPRTHSSEGGDSLPPPLAKHGYGHNFSTGSSREIGKEAGELAFRQRQDLIEVHHLHQVVDRQEPLQPCQQRRGRRF